MNQLASKLMDTMGDYGFSEWPALPGQKNNIRCGVLVPAYVTDDITVFVGVRSRGLGQHAGEICFPGGRPEVQDENLQATALREAREEMGIESARIVGRLSSMPLYTSEYRLEPFVGLVDQPVDKPDGRELVEIVPISIRDMLSRSQIASLAWDNQGETPLAPVFDLGGRLMFGATAYAFFELLQVVAPLFDAKVPPLVEGPYTWPDVVAWAKGST